MQQYSTFVYLPNVSWAAPFWLLILLTDKTDLHETGFFILSDEVKKCVNIILRYFKWTFHV